MINSNGLASLGTRAGNSVSNTCAPFGINALAANTENTNSAFLVNAISEQYFYQCKYY